MASSLPIYYNHKQPLLMNDDDDDVADHNNGIVPSSTARGRPIARSSSATARRTNSSLSNNGSSVRLRRGDDPAGSENSSSSELAAGGNNSSSSSSLARIKRCQTAPGYVSLEDIFLCRDVQASQRRSVSWRDEEDGVISDPLVRKATQLYAGFEARDHLQPRHSRTSPGPLGTRRGSAMHWLAKKYVCPCLGFLGVLFCGSEDSGLPAPQNPAN